MEQTRPSHTFRSFIYATCLTCAVLVSLLLISLAWAKLPIESWLGRFKFLEIKAVQISAGWPLTPDDVRTWLPPIVGRNIFLVAPTKLITLLEKKPWVSSVMIRKAYPDRVEIAVDTKIPRALMIVQTQLFYVDAGGLPIDKVTSAVSRDLDLPLISVEKDQSKFWKIDEIISLANELPTYWKNLYKVSQVQLEDYPYFKVYLNHPRVEILLSFENWAKVIAEVPPLIQNPPSQLRQVRRINLVFPKKAIVSSSLSN